MPCDSTDRFKGEDRRWLFVDDVNQLTLIEAIAVYTAPMSLKSSGARLDLFETIVLPMVKLQELGGSGERREAMDEAARRLAGDYRAWLHAELYPLRAAAANDPEYTGTGDITTTLVETGALLEYNNVGWRQPHPVITLLPGSLWVARAG